MSQLLRFLFDECLGKPVMLSLRERLSSTPTFVHITDHFGAGSQDTEWVPKLASEGGWVVITADGGKHSPKGKKLPDICLEFGVTHILLGSRVHELRSEEKAAALVLLWPQIEALSACPAGSRFKIVTRTTRSVMTRSLAIEQVDLSATKQKPSRRT